MQPTQGYKAKNGKVKSWASISDVKVCILDNKAYYFHSVIVLIKLG